MIQINEQYLKLQSSYLFADIARRVAAFQQAHPERQVIKLGIGDVTRPLPPACIAAMHRAVDEMAAVETFRGYGPYEGYEFLRQAIVAADFTERGVAIEPDEIFVSDGAKCDTGNIQELFARDVRVAISDPVYPVYLDTNVMAGRAGELREGRFDRIVYLDGTRENGFVPDLPQTDVDLVYLCFPNNPTGATIDRAGLERWVRYAHEHRALLLYDAAYEAYIRDPALPRSIFEIEGAHEVAIEFRSLSKTAGFTGVRCAYTVVPKACQAYDQAGKAHPLHALWDRRHTTKFNGVSYPVQRAAEAAFSSEGRAQVKELVDYYLENARLIREAMQGLGFSCVGGDNSPYIWVDGKMESWTFFDLLLGQAGVVCTPGVGFGRCGEGFIRISAFNNRGQVLEAMERIRGAL